MIFWAKSLRTMYNVKYYFFGTASFLPTFLVKFLEDTCIIDKTRLPTNIVKFWYLCSSICTKFYHFCVKNQIICKVGKNRVW
jgi:hypothetical protein